VPGGDRFALCNTENSPSTVSSSKIPGAEIFSEQRYSRNRDIPGTAITDTFLIPLIPDVDTHIDRRSET
jgi:hypothetical protein